MQVVQAEIIGRFAEEVDYSADIVVIARWKDRRLVWRKGCKEWQGRLDGYVYCVGNFEYQTESEGNYFKRLRTGFSHELTPSSVPSTFWDNAIHGERPRLSKDWVARAVEMIRQQYDPEFPSFEYKRGKTMLLGESNA